MIALKNLSFNFGNNTILEKSTLNFAEKKLTALIGRNGSGKSTLLKALCGLNKKYEGEIHIDGTNIKDLSTQRLAKKIAFVNTSRPKVAKLKCKDIVALGRSPYTAWHGLLSKEDEKKVMEALEMVGMKDYSNRYFNSLSDGEAQKIMVARAIAQDTDIILLDEPTSFLDLPTRVELIKLLKRLAEKEGKTIIYSTHELDLATKFSHYIGLIDSRQLTLHSPTEFSSIDSIFS